MKIIYFHQYFNTLDMPGSTRSFEMAHRLVKQGHEVHMVTTKRDNHQLGQSNISIENGIHVYWLPVSYSNNMSFFRRLLSFILFSFHAAVKGLQLKGDLIFATSTPLTIIIPAIINAKLKRAPLVFEVRDLWPEIPIAVGALKSKFSIFLARRLEVIAYHGAKRIIALSPGMKAGIVARGFPKKKITIIPNISNILQFSANKVSKLNFEWLTDSPLVIYTGALGHVNGVTYLVKVAQEMLKLNFRIRFLIAGEGIEKKLISDAAKKAGVLNNNLFIIDSIPKQDIPRLFSRATVVTSLFIDMKELWHNSANKFFDGLAAGKPLMINYGGWHKELLETHRAGIAVSPKDPIEAANRLHQLISDSQELETMGKAARILAKEKFSVEKLYHKFEQTLLAARQEFSC